MLKFLIFPLDFSLDLINKLEPFIMKCQEIVPISIFLNKEFL